MARVNVPELRNIQYNNYLLSEPGWGGLNLAELEYDVLDNQSPYMINMMVSNGILGKRYGQGLIECTGDLFEVPILALGRINNVFYAQTERSIFKVYITNNKCKATKVIDIDSYRNNKGTFYVFNNQLLFLNGHQYLIFDDLGLVTDEPYIPDIAINMNPDGSYADLIEDYNRLTRKFRNTFDGDGASTAYKLTSNYLDGNASDPMVEVLVGTEQWTYGASNKGFTVDWTNGTVNLSSPAPTGINNVVITASTLKDDSLSIQTCKYMISFGGNNNSRMFLAGNGTSTYYYSGVFDASYFPESQYARIGNLTDDITGFGEQYSTLIIFKPDQVYGLNYSYDEIEQRPIFTSYTINALIGCDCPFTIAMVNNQLTWLNSTYGVCTMISTTIKDEKNVVYISRNINGGMKQGLLDNTFIKENIAFNYDGKYWICETSGNVYVWDYHLTPFSYSGQTDSDAMRLAWFKFTNMTMYCAIAYDRNLYFGNDNLMTLNRSLSDYVNGEQVPIVAYYKTKMFDFGYIDYLKTVKEMYVEVRGDTATLIRIKYITEENPLGEYDPEDIAIYSRLWDEYSHETFGWQVINFKKEFVRNVSLKKINIFGILFENDQDEKDMSISSLKLKWYLSQKVR